MRKPFVLNKALGKDTGKLAITVQRTEASGKEYASVLFTTSISNREAVTEKTVEEAFSNLYGNKLRVCGDSLHKVPDAPKGLFKVLVANNAPMVSYETASGEGWTNVAADMFADASDNLWDVVGEGSDRMLRRQSTDDLMGVLEERRSRSIATAAAMCEHQVISKHAAVLFYDTASEKRAFGIAINDNQVFVPSEKDTEADGVIKEVAAASVIAVVPHDRDAPAFNNPPELAGASKRVILDYYGKLYGKNSAMYNHIRKLVEELVAA